MHKLFAAIAVMAAIMALAALMPLGAGQAPQVGGGEQFKVPVAAPVQNTANPLPPPNTQPPQNTLPPNYLPTSPGFQNPPILPTTGPDKASGQNRVLPSGFPDPMASFLQGPVQYSSDGLLHPGGEGEKLSVVQEFLRQDFDAPDVNRDFAINPQHGPFAICVQWYSGKDAAAMARELVTELRQNPNYRLANACTWRKGAEECKAEQKRILAEYDKERKRREEIQKIGQQVAHAPFRVAVMPSIGIEYAVLVGGFKDRDSAKRELERVKKLPPPDPQRVKLHTQYAVTYDEKGAPKEGKYAPINPFVKTAMVVENPAIAKERAGNGNTPEDLANMRKLNADEEFSLFKCQKKYTLEVKKFAMPAVIQTKNSAPASLLDKFSFGSAKSTPDYAKHNAHNLADLLRKAKTEAYVLHTAYLSYVTVGSYDNKDDPRIPSHLEQLRRLNQELRLDDNIKLVPRTPVLEVPR